MYKLDLAKTGTRDEIANVHWVIEKARESQKNICFIDYAKVFDCVDHNKLENSERDGNTRPPYLPPEKPICRSRSKLELNVEQQTGSKLGKECIKIVYITLFIKLICRVHHAKCWAG